ncbi:S8 family serine peptidase [Cribrihabitans pelagius]|uniref:S8 family serine peptidase n=1 Tax=Cribrihabitans pelagius TaxID=1765746 RepID=UPI003B5B1BB8
MERYTLDIGGTKVELKKSRNQIALRPRAGADRALQMELEALARRQAIQRREPLGTYEIVEIDADAATIRKERGTLRSAASVGQEVAVYYTSDDNVPFVPEGTIYLEFADDATTEARQAVIDKYALQLVEAEPDGALTVRVSSEDDDAVGVCAKLLDEDAVAIAEPDLATPGSLKALDLPIDRLLDRQWHLRNTGRHGGHSVGFKEGADARIIQAWETLGNLGNPNAVIGVIDDGFDLTHPDLASKAIHPWDFTRQSIDVSPVPNLHSHDQGAWHGTACAGVAAASAGHGDVIGAAPNAQLIPVRWGPNLEPRGVAKWFDHMTENGAWVLSCSWGAQAAVFPLHSRISKAISRCARNGRSGKGTVILFAAGNSNRDVNDLPNSLDGFAVHRDVVAVAASTSRDERANYSNFGDEISICAPSSGRGGWGIVTSDVRGTYIDAHGILRPMGYAAGDYDFSFGGTSSACPLAAGAVALVLSANPDLTAAEVRQIIEETARKIGAADDYDADGHSRLFGYGCIDAAAAVTRALKLRCAG